MGFEGPYYATEVLGTGVRVMTGSVGLAASDVWTAVGMVRNDTEQIVTGIVVTARLTRPDGGAIDTATAPVAVRNVRPGEPAPFAIRSTTAASAVGGVAWAVTFRRASAAAAMSRMVEISLVRSIVLSGRDLDSSLKPTLPAGAQAAPFREVAWGMLKSWSSRTIRRPAVVALWVDGDGRAVRLGAGRVLARGHRKGRTLAALRSGEAAEFVLAVPSVPSRLDRAALRVALWETSS